MINVTLTPLHYIYLIFIIVIIIAMVKKRDISLICILGIFILGLMGTQSLSKATMGIFNSFVYATKELMPTIFIISVVTAMSRSLIDSGINDEIVSPFKGVIKNYWIAYWVIGIVMMILSWFFWPSPAVALIGALFLPLAKKAGLPAMGVAIAMNLFGHGIALSSDYIIQAAPKLTADAAGIPIGSVISASVPLAITMGVVTTTVAFYYLRKDIKSGAMTIEDNINDEENSNENKIAISSKKVRRALAFLILVLFALDLVIMFKANLQGNDATALIGGTAVFILSLVSVVSYKKESLEKVTENLVKGLRFGFKIFGVVIPVAAFFYLGDSAFNEIFGKILPEVSHGIVNDLGLALANLVPINSVVSASTLSVVGAITGLDGSGFSGISLVGSVSQIFSTALGGGIETLTALGQLVGIWVGGGTIVPWAVIPVAAICGIDPFELTKKNFKPVVIGIVVTTLVAIFII
ncbi:MULTISPECIES: TRAP transporter large permease subunit [Clostridium]|jgi:TRAP-type C4-dicarboxylate transport system permease large subunit|uniref:TRAP transporter large permease subunit n=1 Tax=Clostridium TaxID=1485 RepID=UPI0018A923F4|nr:MULTISPECIES: TRAP transporter large permease subunit [Clostridium]MDB1934927.1 TRAP transporter large permease subunit [Clostridium tertium]MDB1938841.1 TRAP transporter large permease subunit [Clostridium tertium]MDB1969119.1 TRAP transporter large permease subunit [Clostridium tertium]MDU4738635.1 TRAP transporter large permease subunit [Clostridium sp.]MDU6362953.1 TRAP transporter large permease subunit [Clostridium sp.]